MPDVLVLDMQKLLDESKVGKEAAKVLEQKFKTGQEEFRKLKDKAAKATGAAKATAEKDADVYEANTLREIEQQRATLRQLLLARAQPVVEQTMSAMGAKLVVDRGVVISADPTTDITYHVMGKVDAGGPLEKK